MRIPEWERDFRKALESPVRKRAVFVGVVTSLATSLFCVASGEGQPAFEEGAAPAPGRHLDPAGWGKDHVGSPVPEYVTGDECLFCHEDPDLTAERDGREISAFVDAETFASSVHGDFTCVDCHLDLEGQDAHEDEVEAVDCGVCHDGEVEELAVARHGRLAPTSRFAPDCGDCHGYHDVAYVAERPPDCASCHDQSRLHARSLHGQAEAASHLELVLPDRGRDVAPGLDHQQPAAGLQGRGDLAQAVLDVRQLVEGMDRHGEVNGPLPVGETQVVLVALDRLDEEIERLQGLGATIAWEEEFPPDVAANYRNVVLRDPEGNEFCLGARGPDE